ncbi:MAG: class I SAM-dependent methyltransferase [Minisyncoccales bacterium]
MKKKKQLSWYIPQGGFFNKDYLQQYQEILSSQKTKKEVDFIKKVLKLKPGMKILDLCCGYGRHSIELATRGYQIVGQDINPFFLKEAEKSAKKIGVKIQWVESDMRKIPFEKEFDVVLNLFTSFGYFEKNEDHQKVISEVCKVLKTKGIFFLDVMNREHFISYFKSREEEERNFSDASVLVIKRKFNFVNSRLEEKRTYIKKKGGKKETQFSIRIFTLTELISMCQKAGLTFKESYGNYQEDPVNFETKRCIVISQKTH